jgi:hypothetical protein
MERGVNRVTASSLSAADEKTGDAENPFHLMTQNGSSETVYATFWDR